MPGRPQQVRAGCDPRAISHSESEERPRSGTSQAISHSEIAGRPRSGRVGGVPEAISRSEPEARPRSGTSQAISHSEIAGRPRSGRVDHDAVLVVSFGGPEGPDDVLPFLDNVLAGRSVPAPVKNRIAQRYLRFGGVSPINAHTRAFVQALKEQLAAHGPRLPVYWGNRNWHPFLGDTMRQMAAEGVQSAVAYVTSVFSTYSGCRQYREDLFRAAQGVPGAPRIDKLRNGYNHPAFIAAMTDRVREALGQVGDGAALLFSAHSLPLSMARQADYEAQLRDACALVGERLGIARWQLAYQSNNAGSREPWLAPTLDDALASIRQAGHGEVVVAPIGFVCDHMEVVLDVDVEARQRAEALGLRMARAATVGTHPRYVAMVRELVVERTTAQAHRPYLGRRGPQPDYCAADCCLSGRPGAPKPALCGIDAP